MNFLKKLFNTANREAEEIEKQEVKLSLDDLFVHNFIDKGGKFLYCQKQEEVKENLSKILIENNWKELFVTNKKLLKFLNHNIKTNKTNSKSLPFLTTCEHLISDHGDILFSSNQLKSIKLAELSENFIVFATTSQLVKNTGEGLTGIKINSKNTLPTNISAIKNYTNHKNDDNFLNYGNNNTKNLYLLLLEDL